MVISSSSVGPTPEQQDISVADANLALEWFAQAGKLNWDIYDESVSPVRTPPEGFIWAYQDGRWKIVREVTP